MSIESIRRVLIQMCRKHKYSCLVKQIQSYNITIENLDQMCTINTSYMTLNSIQAKAIPAGLQKRKKSAKG